MKKKMLSVGTAGWSIPQSYSQFFSKEGSHLERYAQTFNAVEINSTFYNHHQRSTFKKWSEATPENFQFSIKLHQQFTHHCDLKPSPLELKRFLNDVHFLGDKWKVLLLQFPPKQEFNFEKMERFYQLLRKSFDGHIVIEPRNESWISVRSREMFDEFKISKVIADPERCPGTKKSEQASGLTYARLHGSPRRYWSSYSPQFIKKIAELLASRKKAWCIFDNTASGHATMNALKLLKASGLQLSK